MCLAAGMALVTFAMGYLPQKFTNARMLHVMSTFGAGSLLGCLTLILFPESMMSIQTDAVIKDPATGKLQINPSTTVTVGLSVMLGFSVMVLVNEITSRMFKSSLELGQPSSANKQVKVATYGMCIHSAAEGLSLGASLFLSIFGQGSLGLIVVLALLLHKAPESIGYGTFLLN